MKSVYQQSGDAFATTTSNDPSAPGVTEARMGAGSADFVVKETGSL